MMTFEKIQSIIWIFLLNNFSSVFAEDFNTIPPPVVTSFTCKGRETGFYADIENNCRVYHTCDDYGNKFTYNCPLDTAFRQEALVCDHAHLVDCKNAQKLISQNIPNTGDDVDDKKTFFNGNKNNQDHKTFFRSFKINPQPSIYLQTPKIDNEKSTTFTMSSTVFLRDHSGLKQQNDTVSTTLKPFKSQSTLNNNRLKFNGSRSIALTNHNNFYFKTLEPVQRNVLSTTPKAIIPGTEFPVPSLAGFISKFQDDPYYPRQSTSTEIHYTLSNKQSKSLPFTTQNPKLNDFTLKVPDRLPNLNAIEDIVDRRKHFYISKATSV